MVKKGFMGRIVAVSFIAMLVATSVFVIAAGDDSSAADPLTVTDGRGNVVTFEKVANHIVTSGKGSTATVIQLGQLDKLVVCDNYSKTGTESVFDTLKTYIAAGKVKADGNLYSSGLDAFKNNVVDAADIEKGGTFVKERDVIILTGGKTTNDSLKEYFTGLGFEKILIWDSITEYQGIIDFATVMSKILTGSVDDRVKSMELVRDTISEKLIDEGVTVKSKALYIRISSSNYAVGNAGSLTTSMIAAAGGENIAFDDSKSKPTYTVGKQELIQMREDYGTDKIVVFLDTTVTASDLADIQSAMGDTYTTYVALDGLWNNYSIDSKDGVWVMACALYPDYFHGDVPSVNAGKGDTLVYIIAGAVTAALVLVAAVVLMRRH